VPDEPHFPAPGEKIVDPYRDPEKPAPAEPSRKIVTRAEPPPSSKPKPAKLTREEINALIAVTAAQSPWKKTLKRSPVLFAATLVGHLLGGFLGVLALPVSLMLVAAALVWIALPLFKRDGFS